MEMQIQSPVPMSPIQVSSMKGRRARRRMHPELSASAGDAGPGRAEPPALPAAALTAPLWAPPGAARASGPGPLVRHGRARPTLASPGGGRGGGGEERGPARRGGLRLQNWGQHYKQEGAPWDPATAG